MTPVRYVGDPHDGYRLQVRVLGLWWTVALADRYMIAKRGSALGGLLDALHARVGCNALGVRTHRVALVRLNSDLDRQLSSEVAVESAKRGASILKRAGVVSALALLLCGSTATLAQEASPPMDPVNNPITQSPLAASSHVSLWGMTERVWAEGAAPADLPGAYAQAQLGLGRWSVSGQAAWSGLPGEFDRERITTVRAASAYLAGHWNVAALPAKLVLSPMVVVGSAIGVDPSETIKVTLPQRVTLGGGVRLANERVSLTALFGQHHSLRGWAMGARWSLRIGGSEVGKVGEIRNLGWVACDVTSGTGTCVAETMVAVSFSVMR